MEKINQINLLDPPPYKVPEEVHADDIEVVDAKDLSNEVAGEKTSNCSELKPNSTSSIPDQDEDDELDIENIGQVTLKIYILNISV